MPYLYDDEDNAPMHQDERALDVNYKSYEQMVKDAGGEPIDFPDPADGDDRDCPHCRHKVNGECQVWDCKFEPKEEPLPFTDPPDGCWNCWNYDGDRCTKNWNNMDESYYTPGEDDKKPDDWCESFNRNEEINPKEFFDEYDP